MSFQQEKHMTQCARLRQVVSTVVGFFPLAETYLKHIFTLTTLLSAAVTCFAQEQASTHPLINQPQQASAGETLSVPAGTRLSLVLTHSVLSRSTHRGDAVYAQTVFPVSLGDEVVIPPGTFVQGNVDRLARTGGRGELHLQSMSVIFPDGYTAPVPGPMNLESDEGYVQLDPGKDRTAGAIAAPLVGLGAGLLIGHAASSSPGTTINGMTVNLDKAKSIGIGGIVGLAAGGIVSLVILTRSQQFFLAAGTPVEMTLQQPMALATGQVSDAIRQSAEHPAATRPVSPRPQAPVSTGTCYTPGTPGTPSTVIPGVPPSGDSPGTPPTVIPGTPAIPGTPYPCSQ
jgi:hypothetical protein